MTGRRRATARSGVFPRGARCGAAPACVRARGSSPGMTCAGIADAGEALDLAQRAAIAVVGERDGDARRAGAAGAADAVDVVLGLPRQVEVDDVADAGDVECRAPRRRSRPACARRRGACPAACGCARAGSCRRAARRRRGPAPCSRVASASASRLVAMKTMLCLIAVSASRWSSRRCLCAWSSAKCTRCSIASGAGLLRLDVDAHRVAHQARGQAARWRRRRSPRTARSAASSASARRCARRRR